MTSLLSLAIAMFAGLMMTRAVKRLQLPDLTASLVAGVLIGPCAIGALGIPGVGFSDFEQINELSVISDVALGFIAFSIGNEFRMSQLKKTGRQAFVIGVLQAVTATLTVDAALIALHLLKPDILSLPAAITLGAIAAATAPAATLMVVRQYKAKGELTSLLLPIVALDDAVGLVLFAVSFGVAKALGSGSVDVFSVVIDPIIEITASLLLGAAAGLALTHIEKYFNSNTNRLVMTISFVLLTVALSMVNVPLGPVTLGFSPLLVCMMLGCVFCNLCPLSEEIMSNADRWTAPLLVLFFVISGAQLELGVFRKASSVLIGLLYILTRSIGKYFGARESAKLTGCGKNVVDYLGVTLLPQAGVALGMCVSASALPGDGALIRNIVLFAVLIYELVGPSATKWALTKAGDIKPVGEEVIRRRERKLAEAAGRRTHT